MVNSNYVDSRLQSFPHHCQHPHSAAHLNPDISEPAPSKHLPQASLTSWSKLPSLGSIASRTQEEPMTREGFKSCSEPAAANPMQMLEMIRICSRFRWNSILLLKEKQTEQDWPFKVFWFKVMSHSRAGKYIIVVLSLPFGRYQPLLVQWIFFVSSDRSSLHF